MRSPASASCWVGGGESPGVYVSGARGEGYVSKQPVFTAKTCGGEREVVMTTPQTHAVDLGDREIFLGVGHRIPPPDVQEAGRVGVVADAVPPAVALQVCQAAGEVERGPLRRLAPQNDRLAVLDDVRNEVHPRWNQDDAAAGLGQGALQGRRVVGAAVADGPKAAGRAGERAL